MFHEYMRRFNYGILNLQKYKRVPDFTPFPKWLLRHMLPIMTRTTYGRW